MFESGIGPGVRSNRFGTWSLATTLVTFCLASFDDGMVWAPLWACALTTAAALLCGLAGLFVPGQRRPAMCGLVKAAVPVALVGLLLLALSSTSFE
jgi:hypothetical protein